MAERSVVVRLQANIAAYSAAMAKAGRDTKALGSEVSRVAASNKKDFTTVGLAAGAAGAAVAVGLGKAVTAAADFDAEMSRVAAVAGATADELGDLRTAAIDAGKATAFSAGESAQAISELTRAGVSTADVLGGALLGSLDLAAAGGLDLADAATVAAQAMNIFGLEGSDTVRIADTLAAGANKSAADVGSLGDALRQGGLVASQYGIDLETTVGALSLFADNALVGSDAGTSFKTMLQRLTPQSDEAAEAMADIGFSAFDARGQFVGLDQVAGQLQVGLAGLTDEQRNATLATIFGSDAVRGAAVLMEAGADGVRDYTAAVTDQGAAAEMAAVMLDNWRGDLEELGGSIETLQIEYGENMQGLLRSTTQTVTGVVNSLSDLPEPVQNVGLAVGGIGAAAGLAGGGLLLLLPRIVETRAALATLGVTGATVKNTLLSLNGLRFGALAVGIGVLATEIAGARAEAEEFVGELGQLDTPQAQIAMLTMELERQRDVAGALGSISPFLGTSKSATDAGYRVNELESELARLREEMEAAAGSGRTFATHQEALNYYLSQGYTYADALAQASLEMAQSAQQADTATDGWTQRLIANNAAAGTSTTVTASLGEALDDYLATLQAFSQPMGAYSTLLADKEEAERQSAQATADATESSEDSWEDYYDSVTVSIGEWLTELEAQKQAEADWALNMETLAGRVSQSTLDELARLGPEGAPLVADLVNASDEEIGRLEAVMGDGADDGINAFESRIANAAEVGRRFGADTVRSMTDQLRAGTMTVEQIARTYAAALASGVNPILLSLGKPQIDSVTGGPGGRTEFFDGGMVPGGRAAYDNVPAMIASGEYVMPNRRVAEPGAAQFLETMRQAGLESAMHERMYASPAHYFTGGFVSSADVPGVPSVAPFSGAVGRPATGTMGHGRDAVVSYLDAMMASGGLPVGPGQIAELLWRTKGHYNHMHLASRDQGWLVGVGRKLQRMGARVAEHPAFGGVRGRHAPNSYHYSGQAIDANYGPGGQNATEMAFFDRVVPQIRAGTFDQGGPLMPGWTLAHNATGSPEMVIPPGGAMDVNVVGFSGAAAGTDRLTGTTSPSTVDAAPLAGAIAGMTADEVRELTAEIAANQEAARVAGLSTEELLAETVAHMGTLIPWTDEWVAASEMVADLQGQIAADTAAEAKARADAAQAAREQTQQQAQAAAAEADRLAQDLNRLLDQRDQLQQQQAQATASYARAVADAQARAAGDIDRLLGARNDALFGAFGSIDRRFEVAWGNTAGALTGNIVEQIALFDEWADGLAALRARGVSEDLVAQLGLDDPAQLGQVRLLLAANAEELAALDAALTARRTQTAAQVADESDQLLGALGTAITRVREDLAVTMAELRDDLNVRLSQIGEEMAQLGQDGGRSYAEAMAEALTSGLPAVVAVAQQYEAALARAQAAAAAAAAIAPPAAGAGVAGSVGGSLNRSALSTATPQSYGGGTMTLRVGEREFTGYVETTARNASAADTLRSRLQGVR